MAGPKVVRKKRSSQFMFNPGFDVQMTIEVRRKGRARETFSFSPADAPHAAQLYLDAAIWNGKSATVPRALGAHLPALHAEGIVVPADQLPSVVTPTMTIEASLLAHVSASARQRAAAVIGAGARLAPEVHLQVQSTRPASCTGLPPAGEFPVCAPTQHAIVWARNPTTRMWMGYQIDATMAKLLRGVLTKHRSVRTLPRPLAELLFLAGILCDRAAPRRIRPPLERDGFAVVRDVLPPLLMANLVKRQRDLHDNGYFSVDTKQVKERRLFAHNDVVARFVHRQTGELLRRVTGEMIIPSYCIWAEYFAGAELTKHVDRPQCEWNASLLFASTTETRSEAWPLCFEVDGAPREARLSPGDLVIYRGRRTPHWRPPLPAGQRASLLLFHYVPFDFVGSLD